MNVIGKLSLRDRPGPLVMSLERVNLRSENWSRSISIVIHSPVIDAGTEIGKHVSGGSSQNRRSCCFEGIGRVDSLQNHGGHRGTTCGDPDSVNPSGFQGSIGKTHLGRQQGVQGGSMGGGGGVLEVQGGWRRLIINEERMNEKARASTLETGSKERRGGDC